MKEPCVTKGFLTLICLEATVFMATFASKQQQKTQQTTTITGGFPHGF